MLNDGKGNFAVCASKVVDLNKLFFATKDVEAHGYVNTLVYQTAFDEIESELEKFRCQIYKAKYVPVKASPISGWCDILERIPKRKVQMNNKMTTLE